MDAEEYPEVKIGELPYEFPHILVERNLENAAFISLKQDQSLIKITWQEHVQGSDLRNGFLKSVLLAGQYELKYWFADARKLRYLLFEDQNWLAKELAAQIAASSLRKMALVVNTETILVVTSAELEQRLPQTGLSGEKILLETFDSDVLANYWLFEYNKPETTDLAA